MKNSTKQAIGEALQLWAKAKKGGNSRGQFIEQLMGERRDLLRALTYLLRHDLFK